MRALILCWAALISIEALFAQEAPANPEIHQVEITVLAKGNARKIPRAEIAIGKEVFFTNPEGKASLSIPSGEGKIAINRHGYESRLVEFETLRKQKNWEIFLYPGQPSDNEVYIRGTKRPGSSKKSFSSEESARVAPGGDPVQVAKLLPGVQSNAFGTDVAIRGSGPEDSIYTVDNYEIPGVFHFIAGMSVIPNQIISDVEFSSGGFGPEYGDATGGVISIKTKSDIPEEAKTEFRTNIPFYTSIFHERPLSEDSSLAVSVRRSYLELFLPMLIPKDNGPVVVPYFSDAHVLYTKKKDDGGHLKVLGFGVSDGLKLQFDYEESDSDDGKGDIDLKTNYASIGFEDLTPLGDGWSATVSPQFYYDRTRNIFFDDFVNWDFYRVRAHVEAIKKFSAKEYLYVGMVPTYSEMNIDILAPVGSDDPMYDYEDAPREKLDQKFAVKDIAAWTSIDKQFSKLIITPGVRGFYNDQMKQTGFDPRLNLRYEADPAHTFKGAIGQYSKSPSPQEADSTFGNPDLDFEKAMHYVFGVESRWADRWETDFEFYYKKIRDVVFPDSEEKYLNSGVIKSWGLEFFIRRNLTERLFGWLSYTYSKTLEQESTSEDFHPAEYDQTHNATLAGSYRLTGTWDLGTRITYHSGNTYTPIKDAVYNANLDKYQPRADDDDTNGKRLPAYHQIDLFVTKDFLYNHWKLALRGGVNYLAFKKQVFTRSYNHDYSEEQDIYMPPMLPFIELRGEF